MICTIRCKPKAIKQQYQAVKSSSENPIIGLSLNKNNYTYEIIKRTNKFTVSILSEETNPQVITQLGFQSGKDRNKFNGLKVESTMNNLPIVKENCCGFLCCDAVSYTHLDVYKRQTSDAAIEAPG